MQIDRNRLTQTLQNIVAALFTERNDDGYWEGELSSSALSTATAVCAFAIVQRNDVHKKYSHLRFESAIQNGLTWLADHQNEDGGWGDTVISESNISTTVLSWAVFTLAEDENAFRSAIEAAERWIAAHAGGIEPKQIAQAILARYGKDRTFSVPILTHCALLGRLGPPEEAWRWVYQLPFELAALPYQWFAALRLPVVSYALPALIAIGQARHYHRPTRNPIARFFRWMVKSRTLDILRNIQPTSGGFLEATPLTSFVTMSLAGSGNVEHPVVQSALRFLTNSILPDGSWAIDTNLATWVTTLSINALARHSDFDALLPPEDRDRLSDYLLKQHYREEHPYTHAAPGGWAWTHLPGGVPDADDTSGALLALYRLEDKSVEAQQAAKAGIEWLVNLQNTDGGVPTFCRGWSNLPFDRSCPDITAHALQSMALWKRVIEPAWIDRMHRFKQRAMQYLIDTQQADGSWHPLWFGNEREQDHFNKTYGTAQVIIALCQLDEEYQTKEMVQALQSGVQYLLQSQSKNGGWGGACGLLPSIEETGLATLALALYIKQQVDEVSDMRHAALRGAEWLIERTQQGTSFPPAAIGFYFAELWYFEKLYPMIFSLAALSEMLKIADDGHATN